MYVKVVFMIDAPLFCVVKDFFTTLLLYLTRHNLSSEYPHFLTSFRRRGNTHRRSRLSKLCATVVGALSRIAQSITDRRLFGEVLWTVVFFHYPPTTRVPQPASRHHLLYRETAALCAILAKGVTTDAVRIEGTVAVEGFIAA